MHVFVQRITLHFLLGGGMAIIKIEGGHVGGGHMSRFSKMAAKMADFSYYENISVNIHDNLKFLVSNPMFLGSRNSMKYTIITSGMPICVNPRWLPIWRPKSLNGYNG